MKKTLLALSLMACVGSSALADIVYVTSLTQGCTTTANCPGPNGDGTYTEVNLTLGYTTAKGTAPGRPITPGGTRAYLASAFLTDTTAGVDITPTLGTPGGVYKIDYNYDSQTGGNVSTNVIMAVTASEGSILSFATTDKFQRQFGNPRNQWQLMGYITNGPGITQPTISFRYQSGDVSAAGTPSSAANRLMVDCWRFTLVEPCIFVNPVAVTGPLSSNVNQVVVTGVSATATNVSVYQDSGTGMVLIGQKTSAVTAGNNSVTVSGLIKNAQVAATQTIDGQEGCVPTSGLLVGGGANPRVRVVLNVRETTSTGPVGTSGSTAGIGANIHFLGASTRIGGAPADGPVLTPSTDWQTLTFDRGTLRVGNPATAAGAIATDVGYAPNDTVAIRVYAFRTPPETNVRIFSSVPAQSSVITSNDSFAVNWSWDAVPDAEGYRLLRNYNSDSYTNSSADIFATSVLDQNNIWGGIAAVTPSVGQTNASVKWNSAGAPSSPAGTQNDLQGQWGTIDAIVFAIDDLEDTGPFEIYIDNLKNGNTVFQDFEGAPANTSGYGIQRPGISGTTSGFILGAPDQSIVSNAAADTGGKSQRIRFQWNSTTSDRWVRVTTSAAVGQNPQINLDDPTSIRFLILPVGQTPVSPPAPTLSVQQVGPDTVLNWSGTHRLQASDNVTGPYTTVSGVTNAPWSNTFPEPQKFFRLVD
jgi:hypothetical protein